MAEIYVVSPLDTHVATELASYGIPHPAPPAELRSLTPRTVLVAVCGLPGLEATVQRWPDKQLIRITLAFPGTGDIRLAGSGTEVNLRDVIGEEVPCRVTFRGGTFDLVASVVERIAAECGAPLVLWPASGADPVVISG